MHLEECGWMGGDSSGDSAQKKPCSKRKQQMHLTLAGLPMEGDYTQNRQSHIRWRQGQLGWGDEVTNTHQQKPT
jgi:hypothetical protein